VYRKVKAENANSQLAVVTYCALSQKILPSKLGLVSSSMSPTVQSDSLSATRAYSRAPLTSRRCQQYQAISAEMTLDISYASTSGVGESIIVSSCASHTSVTTKTGAST
jgi:hypothetical protein